MMSKQSKNSNKQRKKSPLELAQEELRVQINASSFTTEELSNSLDQKTHGKKVGLSTKNISKVKSSRLRPSKKKLTGIIL